MNKFDLKQFIGLEGLKRKRFLFENYFIPLGVSSIFYYHYHSFI